MLGEGIKEEAMLGEGIKEEAMLGEAELECGICYRPYNRGRRCPRLLDCKHRFCASCLLRQGTATRLHGESDSQPGLVCALCRHLTVLPAGLRDTMPADQELLRRLEASGSLEEDQEEDEEPDTEESPETKDETVPRTRKGRMWRTVKKLCSKITGQNRRSCITHDEMRDLVLISCYVI